MPDGNHYAKMLAGIAHGIDPRTPEGQKQTEELCAFLARAYRPYAPCWQATNEQFNPHFRAPLTAEESRNFIIACLRGLRTGDPDAIIGHNSVQDAGLWDDFVREIDAACDCDYTGLDLYNGSWTDGGPETYIEKIRQVYELLGQYEQYVVGETTVKVEHCLMALPGASLDTITHVYSHEQG